MADANTHIRVSDQDRISIIGLTHRSALLLNIGHELTLSMTPAQAREVALAITNYLVAANPVSPVAEVRAEQSDGAA